MSKKPTDGIRESILGPDRVFRVLDGDGARGTKAAPPSGTADEAPCPVTPLGDADGVYHFLDPLGQKRDFKARALGSSQEVLSLFRGDETWLRERFPDRKEVEDEKGAKTIRVVGFSVKAAAAWLIKSCSDQGLFGDFVQLRKPGIWRGEAGMPIVHCGDEVLIDGEWHPAGTRTGDQIWVATPPTPRPGIPCDHAVGEALREEIQRLWKFRLGGAPHLLVGLVATGMLGTAARWRPNGFLSGEGGSGKSLLMDALRAASPMHAYSNNASEAGVASMMNGRVVPIFIDESSDRQNQGGAEALMDLVLASASGDGTKAVRGRPEGGFRTIELAGCILYGSVNPPPMQPQHIGRITHFELVKPEGGADARAEQEALQHWAQKHGPVLFGRVISAAERWARCLIAFRNALAKADCAAREQDQLGALIAGWWVACREGLPGEAGVQEAIGMVSEFIRPAAEAAEDGGPRRAVQHFLSSILQYDGTTRQETVAALAGEWWDATVPDFRTDEGFQALCRHGIRPVRRCLNADAQPEACPCRNCVDGKYRIPRVGVDAGMWLLPVSVKKLFKGAPGLEGERWRFELGRIGNWPNKSVRVGRQLGKCLWLSKEAIDGDGGE